MRALVDMVDSLTSTVRYIIGLFVLGIFAFVFIMVAGASYMAPKISEDATAKAAAFGEKALVEARQQRREHELAEDGWGYGSTGPAQNDARSQRSSASDDYGEGWGDTSR